MAYTHTNEKGVTYYLHANERTTKTGKVVRLYYFSKKTEGALDAVPDGYVVHETNTGMLVLKKAS